MGYKIIFEGESHRNLRYHELKVITILLNYFECDIICLCPRVSSTPDLVVKNIEWELKSPIGDGPKTIEKILKKAAKQSKNIVLDFSRSKMNGNRAIARTKAYLRENKHSIKRLLVITKSGKVLDFKGEL